MQKYVAASCHQLFTENDGFVTRPAGCSQLSHVVDASAYKAPGCSQLMSKSKSVYDPKRPRAPLPLVHVLGLLI
eukprot:3758610-Amphidinium_carterae.1